MNHNYIKDILDVIAVGIITLSKGFVVLYFGAFIGLILIAIPMINWLIAVSVIIFIAIITWAFIHEEMWLK